MNKKTLLTNKCVSLFVILLLNVAIFISSFFGSFLAFSTNHSFGIRDLKSKCTKKNEDALIMSNQIEQYDETIWDILFNENTSLDPFINCASRYTKTLLNETTSITLFDVPKGGDINYSYNHIYGFENSWSRLKEGKIVISYDLSNFLSGSESIIVEAIDDSVLTLESVGKCDGRSNNDRSNLGNIFADEFGLFGFITQEDMDKLNVFGVVKVVSTNQHVKLFNSEVEKWITNYDFSYKNTSFSNEEIQKYYDFYSYSTNNKYHIFFGVLLILLSLCFLILNFLYFRKKKHGFSKKMKIICLIASILIWIILLLIFSHVMLSLSIYHIKSIDTGAFVFSTLFLLLINLMLFFEVLPKNKNKKEYTNHSQLEENYYSISI